MDSDTDQDEDEIQPSFSVTISERGSHCHVVRKVCSESRKGSAGTSSSSGSIEESAMEGNEVFFVENSTHDISSSDSVGLPNDEETSLRVITVCCRPQKPYKSTTDDRVSCAEKAVDDVFDSVPNLNENEGDSKGEVSTDAQEMPEQASVPDETGPELQISEETPSFSAAVPLPVESPSQEVHLDEEERPLRDKSALESKSNDTLSDQSINGDNELPDGTKSRKVQNKASEIHVDSYEAIEMLAQSIIFQSTSVVPVGSIQAVEAPSLSEGTTFKENDQESSSTGHLPGRKRKHSGKKTADAEGAVGGSSAENSVSSGDAEESFENKDSDKEAKKKKNRCAVCRKKVGLTGFECRCGGLFCAVHRYSDKHDCTFDYREMGAQEIRRNNPVVVGEKIQKI